jgi:hypothetical protein
MCYIRRVRLLARKAAHRLAPLSEAEAYARCHGYRTPDVKVVQMEPRRARHLTTVSGEDLRRRFEERLDARELVELDQED